MEVEEWQKRLEETFGTGEFVGASLLEIIGWEDQYGIAMANVFHGFFALSSAFQSFYVDTLRLVETSKPPREATLFWPLVFIHVSAFRLFRAAENLFLKGYPLIGYSLMRELKDRAFMLAAVGRGATSFREANGYDLQVQPGNFTVADHQKMVRARKKADARIRKETIGSTSGFDAPTQESLARWNDLFHAEVHGSNLSFAVDLSQWYATPGALPLTNSKVHQTSVAMFVNRFEEAGWMILRLLPFSSCSSRSLRKHGRIIGVF